MKTLIAIIITALLSVAVTLYICTNKALLYIDKDGRFWESAEKFEKVKIDLITFKLAALMTIIVCAVTIIILIIILLISLKNKKSTKLY